MKRKFQFIKERLTEYWQYSIPLGKRYHLPTLFFFIDRIWCRIVYGAVATKDYEIFGFYRLKARERRLFYTTGRYPKTCKWFFPKEMLPLVDYKKGFSENFKEYLKRDVLMLPCDKAELLDFAQKHDRIFVKENISLGGYGVHQYTAEILSADQNLADAIANMDGVAEEAIVQHPKMASLHEYAVSTIRITTMIEKTGGVKILGSILRIGASSSVVDNVSSGGFFCRVDIETGIVMGYGRSYRQEKILRSPTGVLLPGFQIPFWPQVLSDINSAALKFPKARLIGWDVAISENGPVLVEANCSTGPITVQFDDYGCWGYFRSQR